MKKKMLALALAAAMMLSLAACGGSKTDAPADTSTDAPADADTSADATVYKVGICQLVQHEALDAATQGFIDALNEALPGQVDIENNNASGDATNCATIVNGYVSEGVDLIMANATAALTAAASATADIPILGTSITAYGVALDIDDFNGTVGGNISGTSDLADLSKQADMITEWFRDLHPHRQHRRFQHRGHCQHSGSRRRSRHLRRRGHLLRLRRGNPVHQLL